MDTSLYTSLNLHSVVSLTQINIKPYIPSPTKSDYKRGYIERYFTQRYNDINSPIYEIDLNGTHAIKANPLYNVVELDWRLTGSKPDIMNSNAASIRIASEKMKNISMYLPYLLQFAQITE
jgi:hypothetical protein